MKIKPHHLFKVWSADEVAECIGGVPDVLYKKLWSVMIERQPTPGLDYREIPDDFDDRCLAKSWSEFTEAEQTKLNELADTHEGSNA